MFNMDEATALYLNRNTSVQIFNIPLYDEHVRRYLINLRKLRNQMGELTQFDSIKPFFRWFYTVQRCLVSTFLPADPNRLGFKDDDFDKFDSNLLIIDNICSYRPQIEELLNQSLTFKTDSNLAYQNFQQLSEVALKRGEKCCYVPAPRLFNLQMIEHEMQHEFPNIGFQSHNQLRKYNSFKPYQMKWDSLFFSGPRSWYSDFQFLFDGSRADQIYFIYYSWFSRNFEPNHLSGEIKDLSNPPRESVTEIPQTTKMPLPKSSVEQILSEDDVFTSIKTEYQLASVYNIGEGALVKCRRFDLTGGYSVYLEEKGKVRVLDGADNNWDTPKMDVRRLRKGMYILLRCEGDGDYIRSTAEQMFTSRYKLYVQNLIKWKQDLQLKLEHEGLAMIISKLINHGSSKANEPNVLNWASMATIKPRDLNDFIAIMTLLDKSEEKSKKLWNEARKLNSWHHQAGKRVALELRKSITNVAEKKVEQLIRYGQVTVDLEIGASIDVFEVQGSAEKTYNKKHSQLNRPYN